MDTYLFHEGQRFLSTNDLHDGEGSVRDGCPVNGADNAASSNERAHPINDLINDVQHKDKPTWRRRSKLYIRIRGNTTVNNTLYDQEMKFHNGFII